MIALVFCKPQTLDLKAKPPVLDVVKICNFTRKNVFETFFNEACSLHMYLTANRHFYNHILSKLPLEVGFQ